MDECVTLAPPKNNCTTNKGTDTEEELWPTTKKLVGILRAAVRRSRMASIAALPAKAPGARLKLIAIAVTLSVAETSSCFATELSNERRF